MRSIDIQYNGIEQHYLTANFKHIFNFDTIIDLNLSNNWFGVDGLHEIKDHFLNFKQLKSLKLATSKLCFGPPTDLSPAHKLMDVLMNLPNLEELDLQENSMNDAKF